MSKSFSGFPAIDQAVAGLTAGAVTTIVVHPLDVIKTRLQVDSSPKELRKPIVGRAIKATKLIILEDGISSLYRGLSPNLAGATLSWGFYFYWYSVFKKQMSNGSEAKLSAGQHLIAAAEAGAVTSLCTNPIWVVKTRMLATGKSYKQAYNGLFDGLYQIAKNEGFRGLYRGIVPALFGVSHGALQFMAYEEMKKWRAEHDPTKDKNKLDTYEYILMAVASKVFASVSTYPYQVVKTRLQNYQAEAQYTGTIDTISKIFRSEGMSGFYKGLGPNTIRVLPGTCVTFAVYENMSKYFREHEKAS
ncbi:mitochondrial FAD carrier protein flx1 [Basidiobolus ranarum]|uniref:Mitochondrial FAD carrier protein flx1 n=1 Tax=Basidiobolus ranarum TaxID=34480 RepID=A0ABR2X2D0_9FUNG